LTVQALELACSAYSKADIAEPRRNHFQPSGLTRYDAPMGVAAAK